MSRVNRAALLILALTFCLPAHAQTTAADWIKKAQERVYDGDDQGAYQALNVAVKLEPNNIEAWILRGDTNLPWALANTSKAQRDYNRAITLDPRNCHALISRGLLAHVDPTMSPIGDFQAALKILKAIPNRTPEQQRLYAITSFWVDPKSSLPIISRTAELNPNNTEVLYFLGSSLDAAGRGEEAKVVFRKNQKLLVDELQKHCSAGICRQLIRGCALLLNYPEVIQVLSNYLEKHPDNVHALYSRGYLLNQDGKPKEALRDYARSVELGPQYQIHVTAYGDLEVTQKNYREAAEIYQKGITNDPGSEALIIRRAQCLKELSLRTLALQELDKYLAKNPLSFQVFRAKATIEQKDNPEQAHKDLKRALILVSQKIQASPELYKLYSLRSSMYQDYNEPQKALADLDQAIRIKPDDPNLFNSRAHLKWNYLNLKAEAVQDVMRAINCAPAYSKRAYLLVLGAYYKGIEQYDKTIEVADKCIALKPEDPDGYQLKATAYIAQRKFQNALGVLEKISTLRAKVDDLDLLFARVYVSQNRQKEALTAFNTSIKKHPRNLEARVARGTLHTQMEQYDRAITDFNKALEIAPDNGDTLIARSRAYAGEGQYSKAAADLTEAMQLRKETNEPWLLEDRARFYTYAERYKEAAEDLTKAYRFALDKPLYLYQAGKLLYWSGNKLAAINSISAYLKLVPDLQALRGRARCYFETDQFDKSIEDYTTLIQGDPENPAFYRLRAKSYSKSGNEKLAAADIRKADSLMKSK